MSNIWKRSLSFALAIIMVIGMMPTNIVFAEEADVPGGDVVEETTAAPVEETTEAPVEETTEAPVEETTEAPVEETTEAPVEETTEAPVEETTEAPVEETTEAPVEETTEAPVEETTEAPTEEETEEVKAELSGETRRIYFQNVENWEEVWAAWSFDEEDFEDVDHPGAELNPNTELENVWYIVVPVEADEVLFNDGIEVTDALLEQERLAGVTVTHEIEVRLSTLWNYNLYTGEAWLSYADEVAAKKAAEATEPTEPPTEAPTDAPVMDKAPAPTADPVQALIDSLPASVNSEAEYNAVYAVVAEIEDKGYDLTAEQMNTVFAAMNAADEWYGAEDSGDYVATDGSWYWNDGKTVLYIKNGSNIDLYDALVEKYGTPAKSAFRYTTNGTYTRLTQWTTYATRITDGSSCLLEHDKTYYAVAITKTSLLGDSAISDPFSFTAEHFYLPAITETDNPTSTKATVTTEVISGNNATVTLPQVAETGWVAKVSAGTDTASQISEQTVKLSTTGTTTVTVGPINSAADATISVDYEKAVSYTVTSAVNNAAYGAVTLSATSGIKGTEVTVTVTPKAKNNKVVSVTATGANLTNEATDSNGVYTAKFVIGEANVTINAEFSCLSGKSNANVYFNTHSNVGVSGQMNGGSYFADVVAKQCLEAEIFEALGITHTHAPEGFSWDDVIIKYYPRVEHVLSDNEWSSTAYALNGNAPDDDWKKDYYPKNFYERGINQTEKVQISYDGLIYDATIYLVEGRPAVTIAYDGAAEYTCNTYADFVSEVKNHITVTYTGGNAVWTISENNDNGPGEYTYTVTVAGTANYQPATKNDINVTWEQSEYDISWDTDGDGNVEEGKTATLAYNTKVTAPAYVEKDGWTFKGWLSSANNQTYLSEQIPNATCDVTYTAQYTKDTIYTITFKGDEEDAEAFAIIPINVTENPNAVITAPTGTPTKEGFVFEGWDTALIGKVPVQDVTIVAKWADDTNNNGVADEDETAYIKVNITGNGTVTLSGTAQITNNGNGDYTVLYNSKNAATQTVTINANPTDTDASNTGRYVKETPATVTVVDGETTPVNVEFAVETFALKDSKYEILVNGFNNDTKAESNLKKQVLDDVLGEGTYNINDYKVELLTTYNVGEIDLGERYYNVEGETGKFLWWDYEIPASWFVTQLKVDGKTQNNFKVTKLNKATLSDKDLYHEDVMFLASESRQAAEIQLSKTEFAVDQISQVEALVKAAVQYKKDGAWVDINANHVTVSDITTDGKQNVTITVTQESEDYLKNERGINPEITVTLNPYTVTWVVGEKSDVDTYHVGATIVKPADPTAPEGHSFEGWDAGTDSVVDEVATTMGNTNLTYTAVFTPNTYKVDWTINGEAYTTTDVVYGETVAAPVYAVPEGHTFGGWDIPATMPAEDITLNATLTKNQYKITWKYQTAKDVWAEFVNEEQYFGDPVNLPGEDDIIWEFAIDENTTWTIVDWEGLEKEHKVPAHHDTVFVAQYSPETVYKVTFKSGDDTIQIQSIIPTDENADNDVVIRPATDPEKDGYRFDGWYADAAFTTEYVFDRTPTANETVYAKWVEQVNLTFKKNAEDTEAHAVVTIDINTVIPTDKIPADPDKENAIFGGWYLGEEEYDFDSEVTEDITLTAKWIDDVNNNEVLDENESFTITINKTENGVGEVTITGAKPIGEGKYAFDSLNGATVTINAIPAFDENGNSKSYVSEIKVNGEAIELKYNEDYSVTYEFTVEASAVATVAELPNNVEITFTDCGFVYDEDGQMRFYVGMEDPDYETLYNAVITSPVYDATEGVITAKYLARPAATYQMQVPVLFEYTIPLINYDIKIGGNKVDIDLDDAWLDVGESFTTLTPEELQKQYDAEIQKIKDKIAAIDLTDISLSNAWSKVEQFLAIREELNTLITSISNEAKYLGYHQFGASGNVDENGNAQEILQIIYDNGAMHLQNDAVIVTLADDRIETTIIGGNLTFEYDEFTDETIMNALVLTDADGNVIEGELKKYVDLVGTEVGTRTYSVYYEGSWDYKPCTVEFTLTVIKAPSNVDVLNQTVTYVANGTNVSAPVITNKHGKSIDIDTIEFIVGLDVANLDIDGDGIKGLEGKAQLILTDELQTILSMVGLENGAELNINELISMLTNTGLLEQWGISGGVVDALKQALDSINGIVEANNLLITIGGSYPSDIGAYLHGAVTVDKNYETAFDVGYIVIKPDVSRVYLDWNYNDTNGLFTAELLQQVNLGASAYDDAAFETLNEVASGQINNLFFGLDVKGELVAKLYNADMDPEQIENELDNGGYTQMAFIAEFGNEFYYAVPIVRAFAIIPNLVDVQIVVDGAEVADLYTTTFDNEPVDVEAKLTLAKGFNIPGEGKVTYHYYGIKTNTDTYDSDVAPTNAGAYAITATYFAYDENGKMVALGMDVATLIIAPAESNIDVEDKIVDWTGAKHYFGDQVTAGSAVEGLTPDKTVISAGINTDGDFSENGWEAVGGTVNVDFPRWVDELIAKYAPSVVDGITLKEFSEKLVGKLPDITEKLEELGATNEIVNSLTNAVTNVSKALDGVPENVTLSFKDNAYASSVGAYVIIGIVTDSDHIPSVDAGLLVIAPGVTQMELKWNYEDEDNIWTRELLKYVDLNAKAFNAETGAYDEAATGKITYQFIGIDKNGELIVTKTKNAVELPNGAYIELAYIELEADGVMAVSNLIARELLIVPGTVEVAFVDVNNNNARRFTFDNTPKAMTVQVTNNGKVIVPAEGELTVTYVGVQTNTVTYNSTTAPTHAGVYTVIADYREYTSEGSLANIGAAVGIMAIEPAASTMDVTGGNVVYDGKGHTATVVATGSGVSEPDYTLISGGAYVSGDIDEVGVDAFRGNVNIDFPAWLDKVLAESEFATKGVDTAYLIDFIGSYRDDVLALIPVEELAALGISEDQINAFIEKLDAYVDELLAVLEKLPEDVALTFNDDVTYTEPGYYFYYGIVTDSDHYPSSDTGLLVIEKKDILFDLLDTTAAWDGEGKMVNVNNPENADFTTVIIDRKNNTINIILDEDAQYALNALAEILGVEFDGDVQMSTIMEKYSGKELAAAIVELISELEKLELSAEIQKALTAVKNQLETLPENGTIVINGALPTELGVYEVYGISYSQYFKTVASEAVLEIVPAKVEVVLNNHQKFYGETDPELTYTVKYLDPNGKELADADAVTVTITRTEGEDVGTYAISGTVTLKDDIHYVLVAQPGPAQFEIKPAQVTVKLDSYQIRVGDEMPEFTYTVTEGTVKAGDTLKLNISCEATNTNTVGTYVITANDVDPNYEITVQDGSLVIKESHPGQTPIIMDPADSDTIKPGETIYVDGNPYVLDEDCTAWIDKIDAVKGAMLVTTYRYQEGTTLYETYPTNMYVWYVTGTDVDADKVYDSYKVERISELDDFFKYEGTSIRVNFSSNGIRFFTSVPADKAEKLMNGKLLTGPLAGYSMTRAGTTFKKYNAENTNVTLVNGVSSDVYGGKAGSDFRVFGTVGSRNWFTGMLTGLDTDAGTINADIMSRPYAILEYNGETITLYGGMIQRSIYYVATQNRDYFAAGSAYDNFVENLIKAGEAGKKAS